MRTNRTNVCNTLKRKRKLSETNRKLKTKNGKQYMYVLITYIHKLKQQLLQ